jgi:hypothetical protein
MTNRRITDTNGAPTMTDKTPDIDDTEAHTRRLPAISADDETEGHVRRLAAVTDEEDDTAGHRRR